LALNSSPKHADKPARRGWRPRHPATPVGRNAVHPIQAAKGVL
jgi:hypothetical protein